MLDKFVEFGPAVLILVIVLLAARGIIVATVPTAYVRLNKIVDVVSVVFFGLCLIGLVGYIVATNS